MSYTYSNKSDPVQKAVECTCALQDNSLQSKTLQCKADLVNRFESGNRVMQMYYVYRGGSDTDNNLTPKDKDVSGDPKRGLSTFQNVADVGRYNYIKAQIIETDNLGDDLEAVINGTGEGDSHVSIRPTDDDDNEKLRTWASYRISKSTVRDNPYTRAVKGSLVGYSFKRGEVWNNVIR